MFPKRTKVGLGFRRFAAVALVTATIGACAGSSSGHGAASTAGPTASVAAPLVTSATAPPSSAAGGVSASTVPAEPDPCEKISLVDISTAFGAPSTLIGHEDPSNPERCTWSLTNDGGSGPKVYIMLTFPNATTHNGGASDAVAEVKYNHDFTIQNYPDKVADIEEAPGVGVYAYFDTRERALEVAASPSLALLIQWVSGTSSDFGTPMSDAVRNSLIKMASLAAADLSS